MRSRIRDNGRVDNGRVNGRPVLVDFEKTGVYSSYTLYARQLVFNLERVVAQYEKEGAA